MTMPARESKRNSGRFRARFTVAIPVIAWLAASFASAAAAADEPFRVGKAIAAPDWLSISGTQRIRYETLAGQFRTGGAGSDQLLSIRTTALVEASRGALRLTAELWDVRAYLADSGTPISDGLVNVGELVQANASIRFSNVFGEGSKTDLKVGRYTLDLGSRRLVARNRFRQTTNAFTGALADVSFADGGKFTAFYSLPQRRLPNDRASLLDNEFKFDREDFNQRFAGAFYSRWISKRFGAEGYLLNLQERDAANFASRNRKLTTIGSRYFAKPEKGEIDFEIEGAIQFGDRHATTRADDVTPLDVFASFAHAEIGVTLDHATKPRLALEIDYASGDEDPFDDKYNRFDQLFGPRRRDLGPLGLHGEIDRANLLAPGMRISVQPKADVTAFVHYLAAFLDESSDSFGITGVRDVSGNSGRFGAHQIEAALRWRFIPENASIELGGAYVANGRFLDSAPNATGEGDTRYFYADLDLEF